MWPRSPEFVEALKNEHTLATRADILVGGRVEVLDVPFASSPVRGDRSQFARRSTTSTLWDPALVPLGEISDLIQLGNEVRLWRGIADPLPAPELIPQLTGRITGWDVAYDENGDPAGVDVALSDRCTTLAYERWEDPVSVRRSSAVSLLLQFVAEVFPTETVDNRLDGYDVFVEAQTFTRERNAAILTLCTALGAEFFADQLGGFVLQPVPGVDGVPVAQFVGGDGGNLVTGRASGSDQDVYNGIRVTGQSQGTGTEAPRSAVAKDLDPTSTTRWGGPFGKRIGFVDNVPVRTVPQADVAAAAIVRNTVGAARSVALTLIPDPCLQEGDLCGITFDRGEDELPLYEQHLADRVEIPMDEQGTVSLSTRATQALSGAG